MTDRGGDTGFTLVELVIAVMLSGVVGALVTTAIVVSFHRQSEMDARASAVNGVRQALERTMREVRASDTLTRVSGNELAFQEQTSTGVTRALDYTLVTNGSDTSLVVDESDNGAAPTRRTVVDHLANGSNPVFSVVAPATSWVTRTSPSNPCVDPSHPGYYLTECVGVIDVRLIVDPVRAGGSSVCAGAPVGPGCYVDIADDADIRNNT